MTFLYGTSQIPKLSQGLKYVTSLCQQHQKTNEQNPKKSYTAIVFYWFIYLKVHSSSYTYYCFYFDCFQFLFQKDLF